MSEISYINNPNVTFGLFNPDDTTNNLLNKDQFFVDCLTRTDKDDKNQKERNGHIAIGPRTTLTEKIATLINTTYLYNYTWYDSQD